MKNPFTIALLLFIVSLSKLQAIENRAVGGRPTALSQAYISVSDIWSSYHNQAGIAGITNYSVGVFYESRFMIEELSLAAGTFVLPTKTGNFGVSFYQFGKGSFNEQKLGLAFAKQLSEKFRAGVQLDYLSQRFPENRRSKGFATFEAGMIYNPNKQFFLGAHVFNPISGEIETLNGKLIVPAVFRFGGHLLFTDWSMVILEFQKNEGLPVLIKSGIEFVPIENLALRFGVSGKPIRISAGIGYKIKKVITDIGFSYHGNLGLTPSVSLQFEL